MNEESLKSSNDLIRWLKMLSLPRWAKAVLIVIMLLVLSSALGLLLWGLLNSKLEVVSSAVAMLTVGLPIGLIVIALVFGDGGANKLKELTRLVLLKEVPDAILQNLASSSGLTHYKAPSIVSDLNGCIADYALSANGSPGDSGDPTMPGRPLTLEFKLELNVRKANLVIWLPENGPLGSAGSDPALEPFQSCFFGAVREGYVHNTTPIRGVNLGHAGHVFIKTLGDDFLLNPGERLYFAQDMAFFIRGLLNVRLKNV